MLGSAGSSLREASRSWRGHLSMVWQEWLSCCVVGRVPYWPSGAVGGARQLGVSHRGGGGRAEHRLQHGGWQSPDQLTPGTGVSWQGRDADAGTDRDALLGALKSNFTSATSRAALPPWAWPTAPPKATRAVTVRQADHVPPIPFPCPRSRPCA
jgi:hypothetical protein